MFLYKILKKFSCSHHFLKFFGPWCKGRPCKKRKMALPRPLWTGLKIGCRTKNVDFFKVRDMLTIIWPRKKEHLTNVSSPLKPFYDHLRGCRDNLIFLDFWNFWYACIGKSTHKCLCMHTKNFKNPKNSNYLCDRVSGHKTFLGAN